MGGCYAVGGGLRGGFGEVLPSDRVGFGEVGIKVEKALFQG